MTQETIIVQKRKNRKKDIFRDQIVSHAGQTDEKKSVFKPRPGQMDFTNARWAPVVNCVLLHEGKLLVVQRSESLNFYPGYWNGISGFLDDQKSLHDKIRDEISEELGISEDKIFKIRLGRIFDQDEPEYKKTWVVHPVLVDVSTVDIRLDWEAQKFAWLSLSEVRKLKLLPGFDRVLRNLSSWIRE